MSYSTLQPGMNYAIWESIGYVAWVNIRTIFSPTSHAILLSNPIAHPSVQSILIDSLQKSFEKLTLIQIDEALAETLYRQGYKIYQLGIESEFNIQSFSLEGRKKASLRHWRNKALKAGVEIEEKKLSEMNKIEVNTLCQEWLKRRGGKELSFLTRPMPDKDEIDGRFFWARQKNRLTGFAGFDPIYSKGNITGYYHNFDRICADAVNGTSVMTVLEAVVKFREEDKKILSLGLSPLAEIKTGYNLTNPLKIIAETIFKYGEPLYPFKGNAQHKAKYSGETKKTFVASNAKWYDTMIAAASACGLELKPYK
ncbi:DUF2156 domain-containing protein [Maridesulfovibrio ferrireducens]|uniref:DUF2156 domain-containing protein n=1 Tax=Maridesulfovibrio ferrireducens TaxID=246191 RepID=UPI001A2C4BA9|nr:DUF2156 domain-containing protein [Maridesulfovibrio ferrireducens]MBI9110809.1 DUF2156 domain-containing protein [Maridesulfovibrio ferrireducens]